MHTKDHIPTKSNPIIIMSPHAHQRLKERLDNNADHKIALNYAYRALKTGKTFEEFIRINETVDRKALSTLYSSLNNNKMVRIAFDRIFVYRKSKSIEKYYFITVLPLIEKGDK